AIVGGSAALAAGAPLSSKNFPQDRGVVCFFGEGALGQGVLFESINLAQLWTVPVVYLFGKNLYNEDTHFSETTAGAAAGAARPAAFGLESASVDGQDVLAVHDAIAPLIARARGGGGPAFVVANTYRFRGHHVGDVSRDYYRTKQEEQRWTSDRDPIAILGARLVESGAADRASLDRIHAEVTREMDDAMRWAIDAPYPGVAEVTEDVYA